MLSERLGLDPLNNDIYATEVPQEAGKKARIVFVVGVDGWSKIINSHPQFDGMKFVESAPGDDELPMYIECTTTPSEVQKIANELSPLTMV